MKAKLCSSSVFGLIALVAMIRKSAGQVSSGNNAGMYVVHKHSANLIKYAHLMCYNQVGLEVSVSPQTSGAMKAMKTTSSRQLATVSVNTV